MWQKISLFFLAILCMTASGCSGSSPWEEGEVETRTLNLNLDITARAGKATEVPQTMHLWVFSGERFLTKFVFDRANLTWVPVHAGGVDLKTTLQAKVKTTKVNQVQVYVCLNPQPSDRAWLDTQDLNTLKEATFDGPLPDYKDDNLVPMSGSASLAIFPGQTNYDLSVDVRRAVARLQIRCTKNAAFPLKVTRLTLQQIPDRGFWMDIPALTPDPVQYTHSRSILDQAQDIPAIYTGPLPQSQDLEGWTDTPTGNDLNTLMQHSTPIQLPNPYLPENRYGGDRLEVGSPANAPTPMDAGKRYKLSIRYSIGEEDFAKEVYLPRLSRNTDFTAFLRVTDAWYDLDIGYLVQPWQPVYILPEF